MGTYMQWRLAADRGEVRRVTWVCGEQRVLVEEVVDTIRRQLDPGPLDLAVYTAGQHTEADIWSAAFTFPVAGKRLVLVRDAQRLTRFDMLTGWIEQRPPGTHLVLVSADADLPTDGHGRKAKPTAYIEAMRAPKGHLVRCGQLNLSDTITWIQRFAALDEERATHLYQRAGGDLRQVRAVASKLALFPGAQISARTIDALCAQQPQEFAEALLFLRKPEALLAAQALPEREYLRTIALLDQRLDLMAVLWRANRAGLRSREIQGQPQFLVRQFLPAAKHYDPDRIERIRHVLAVIDDAARHGAQVGILEALVALW